MKQSIRVFSPATISNVGPGFDLMGFAIDDPGDILSINKNDKKELRIFNETSCDLPVDPSNNVASVGIDALRKELGTDQGFDIHFEMKINPGSGVGSSAASAAAAVFGANELLGCPLITTQLLPYVLEGEFVASKSLHADNAAPALLGGFILIRSYNPIDLIHLQYPKELICVVVHPDIEIKTAESRKLIPENISMKTALKQCGNIAALTTGLSTDNFDLIKRSLSDSFAEPYREKFIPGLKLLKRELLKAGAVGAGISGSGPSVFSFCTNPKTAEKLGGIMKDSFSSQKIGCQVYISKISGKGTRLI